MKINSGILIVNLITSFRLIIAIYFIYKFENLKDFPNQMAILVTFGGITDFLDGYLARKYKCSTKFGKLYDQFADKIFCNSIILLLLQDYLFIFWGFILRDIISIIFKMISYLSKNLVQVSYISKIKTLVVYLGIVIWFYSNLLGLYIIFFSLILAYYSLAKYYNNIRFNVGEKKQKK